MRLLYTAVYMSVPLLNFTSQMLTSFFNNLVFVITNIVFMVLQIIVIRASYHNNNIFYLVYGMLFIQKSIFLFLFCLWNINFFRLASLSSYLDLQILDWIFWIQSCSCCLKEAVIYFKLALWNNRGIIYDELIWFY